ncbi:MAG: hypothetical protein ACR2HV_04285 [Acidimicrobiales bacterium]
MLATWLVPPLVLLLLGGWLVSQEYSFWYDELYTSEMVQVPTGDLVESVVRGEGTIPYLQDAPPSYNGPYYLAARLWLSATGLSPDETGLRLLSLVATAAAMVAFTCAVSRLAGRRVGLVAGLVAATNPFVAQYSAEARGYGLALLAVAVAAVGFARWLDGRPRALLVFGVAGAAAGLAHWFAFLVVVAFAVAGAVLRRPQAWPLVAVTAAAGLPVVGIIGIAVANGVGASGAEWIGGVGGAVPHLTLSAWTRGSTLLAVVTVLAAGAGLLAPGPSGPLSGVVGPDRRSARVVAACWVGVPVVLVTAAEVVRPVFVARYLLPATLGLAVLMALGITRAPGKAAALAAVVVLGTSAWATAGDVDGGPREDVRAAVAAVATAHQAGQPVVAAARWDALGVDHYTRRDHPGLVADLVLPPAAPPSAATIWVVRRDATGVKGDPDKLTALDAELATRGLRVVSEELFEGHSADVLVQRWELRGQPPEAMAP